jgi:sterol desaturase/sphingolipid hydroxylase (fatty acid hydroxylase superfamily)
VLVFEVLLNATSMFSHANLRLPAWLDQALRLVVVTPDMHRVHHSAIPSETNSNFGFNLPWWDFFLGTYRSRPALGQEGMTIGIAQLRDEKRVDRLHWMLALPFLGDAGNYPINRDGKPYGTQPPAAPLELRAVGSSAKTPQMAAAHGPET